MSKKMVVIVLVLVVVVIAAVAAVDFLNNGNVSQVTPGSPVEDGAGDLPPPAALEFENVIVMMDGGYAIDGGAFVAASCAETDPAFRFGSLAVGDTLAELTCLDDYMGGISIKLDRTQPPLYEKLGLRFTDAGEASDKRSWIRRTPEGLTIDVVTKWSQADIDPEEGGQAHVQCGTTFERIAISAKDFAITKSEITDADKNAYPFEPPAKIDSKCL